jgi:hypothetical protein
MVVMSNAGVVQPKSIFASATESINFTIQLSSVMKNTEVELREGLCPTELSVHKREFVGEASKVLMIGKNGEGLICRDRNHIMASIT